MSFEKYLCSDDAFRHLAGFMDRLRLIYDEPIGLELINAIDKETWVFLSIGSVGVLRLGPAEWCPPTQ